MNDLDRKIHEALAADDADLLERFGEQSLSEQVLETFRGRLRWFIALMMTVGFILFGLAIFTAIQFVNVESVRAMIVWGGACMFCLAGVAMLKIWFWLEMSKNALTREIKRVELQVACLAQALQKGKN